MSNISTSALFGIPSSSQRRVRCPKKWYVWLCECAFNLFIPATQWLLTVRFNNSRISTRIWLKVNHPTPPPCLNPLLCVWISTTMCVHALMQVCLCVRVCTTCKYMHMPYYVIPVLCLPSHWGLFYSNWQIYWMKTIVHNMSFSVLMVGPITVIC